LWRLVAHKTVTYEAVELSRTADLIQRRGRWYFNKAFPKELWPITGKAPFRLSLRTDSLELAQRRRADASRRYWAAVDEARAKLGAGKPRQLTEIEVVGLVARWLHETTEFVEASRKPRLNPDEHDAALDALDDQIASYREQLGTGDYSDGEPAARAFLERERVAVDPHNPTYQTLLQLITRGKIELSLIERARLLGDFTYQPVDPAIRAALNSNSVPAPAKTIGDLISAYRADKEAGWSPSTRAAYEPVWRLLKDVLGEQRDVATLNRDEGRRLFETVKASRQISAARSREISIEPHCDETSRSTRLRSQPAGTNETAPARSRPVNRCPHCERTSSCRAPPVSVTITRWLELRMTPSASGVPVRCPVSKRPCLKPNQRCASASGSTRLISSEGWPMVKLH